MEAIAALSLAANIFQVVDFSMKVLATSRELHEAGSNSDTLELQVAVKDLNLVVIRLRARAQPTTKSLDIVDGSEQSLTNLALEAEKLATELTTALNLPDAQESKRHNYRLALKITWNAKQIQQAKQRLKDIREQLQYQITLLAADDIMDKLDLATQQIVMAIREQQGTLVTALKAQAAEFNEVASMHFQEIVGLFSDGHTSNDFDSVRGYQTLQELKATLSFREFHDRFDDISEAHKETYGWALESDANAQATYPKLDNWLRQESGIYWISGKAGSGKSTLMKHLTKDTRLMDGLKVWANGKKLLVLTFYFWNSGKDLQKSQEGLFRSLLLQVLDQEPTLGPVLFPEQYNADVDWVGFPTFHELRRAFMKLASQAMEDYRTAVIVDGLDEFDTINISMTELAHLLIGITNSTHIKALVSSRPLPAFEASFAAWPKLRLHEHTWNDIFTYVHDHLVRDSQLVRLADAEPEKASALVDEIVESASGVFLWVKLVVRSLGEGLQNYDTLDILRKRLEVLTPDLEGLFRHMLKAIPPEYKNESARIFELVRCNALRNRQGHRYYSVPLTATGLYITELGIEAITQTMSVPLTESERHKYAVEMQGRLRSRCAGLIELKPRAAVDVLDHALPGHRLEDHSLVNFDTGPEVVYLHKTVADFLDLDDIRREMMDRPDSMALDSETALLQSLVLQIKCTGIKLVNTLHVFHPFIEAAMHHARQIESRKSIPATNLLDELDKAMCAHFSLIANQESCIKLSITHWCDICVPERPVNIQYYTFLAFAVHNGLLLYVRDMLEGSGNDIILQNKWKPLLYYAWAPIGNACIGTELVLLLLKHGADPNEKFDGASPWERAL